MNRILIASGNESTGQRIASAAKQYKPGFTELTASGNDARRRINENDYDLTIIYAPLKDEFGRDLAVKISEKSYSGIILMCGTDIAADLRGILSEYGIFVIASVDELYDTIRRAEETRQRALSFIGSEKKVRSRSAEIKLVNTAKKLLMSRMGLTEPQAHRYIEKTAMDTRRTRIEVAKKILSDHGEL